MTNALRKITRHVTNYLRSERGAVTVDWVVLSASVIVIGLIVWNIVLGGIIEGASDVRANVLSASNF